MENCDTTNRLVGGPNPPEPTTYDFLSEVLSLKEMVEMLLGREGKRKLRLRHKGNAELFGLYDGELALKHRSEEALDEAKRVLGHFQEFLGQWSPTPELAAGFLAQFRGRKPTTLYRYHAIINGFMRWYGEGLESRIKVPDTLPEYVEPERVELLKDAMRSVRSHKKKVERNVLLVQLKIRSTNGGCRVNAG
mgnify:CR=1 FL=1